MLAVLLPIWRTAATILAWPAKRILSAIPAATLPGRFGRLVVICAAYALPILVGVSALFMWPREVIYSYGAPTCFNNPVILPGVFTPQRSQSYAITMDSHLEVAGLPLYSHTTCIEMKSLPKGQETAAIKLNIVALVSKNISIRAPELPAAKLTLQSTRPIPTSGELPFELNTTDMTFDYSLATGDKIAACKKTGPALLCPTQQLRLQHAKQYDLALYRSFNGKRMDIVVTNKLSTVDAVIITDSSIKPGQIIYDQPTVLSVTLNRPVTAAKNLRVHAGEDAARKEPLTVAYKITGNRLDITFAKALPRSTTITLQIEEITAADGGYLTEPYLLTFKTSGGPKVTNINIGTTRVATNAAVLLRFDSDLRPDQPLNELIRIETNGKPVSVNVSASANGANLKLQGIPACTGFTVKVLDGLQNVHGVSGANAWQYQSRTLCQQVSSIGLSAQGRPITAYKFGSGSSAIIFAGATHGDEKSSAYILQSWIEHLESNPGIIPANRTITVIPIVNPDGYAANKRTNNNNVDLNRNFPTLNWKQSVVMPDKSTNPNGGGASPLSEPESKALAAYTLSQSPRLVLTYHATGGVVIPNDAGDSVALARTYDSNSNLYFQPNSNTATIFEYDTTGSYEDWLREKHAIPTLLIEHFTTTGNEFQRQLKAMQLMIRL